MCCRTLVCHLRPQKRLFAQRFRLVVVDGSKKSVASDYDKDQILEGTCEGKMTLEFETICR